jgi:hypothetical protein
MTASGRGLCAAVDSRTPVLIASRLLCDGSVHRCAREQAADLTR